MYRERSIRRALKKEQEHEEQLTYADSLQMPDR